MRVSESNERCSPPIGSVPNGRPAAYGGLKIGELVEVDDSGTQGTVLDFVEGTPEVVVDHGLYTRCYHHLRLNYVD